MAEMFGLHHLGRHKPVKSPPAQGEALRFRQTFPSDQSQSQPVGADGVMRPRLMHDPWARALAEVQVATRTKAKEEGEEGERQRDVRGI
jgi:hypothetical protein